MVLVEKMNLCEKGFETILRMTLKSINRHVRVMFSSAPSVVLFFIQRVSMHTRQPRIYNIFGNYYYNLEPFVTFSHKFIFSTQNHAKFLMTIIQISQSFVKSISKRIIIGSDQRPETKQGIEEKIDRFRSGLGLGIGLGLGSDRRSEPINFGAC